MPDLFAGPSKKELIERRNHRPKDTSPILLTVRIRSFIGKSSVSLYIQLERKTNLTYYFDTEAGGL